MGVFKKNKIHEIYAYFFPSCLLLDILLYTSSLLGVSIQSILEASQRFSPSLMIIIKMMSVHSVGNIEANLKFETCQISLPFLQNSREGNNDKFKTEILLPVLDSLYVKKLTDAKYLIHFISTDLKKRRHLAIIRT